MRLRKIAYKEEPQLKLHRYIVAIQRPDRVKTCYKFCMNRDEVRKVSADAPKGAVVQVFKANHNFHSGSERI
jgi:hypothetical protein